MQPIVIYFNEQSLLGSLNSYQWKAGISGLCKMLDDFFQLRRDGNIAFLDGQLEEQCGGASIRTQIKEEYGQSRTGYQRFLSKVKKLHSTVLPPLHQMHEMHWNGRRAHGLVLADWQRSWMWEPARSTGSAGLPLLTGTVYSPTEPRQPVL